MADIKIYKIKLIGKINDVDFQKTRCCAEFLNGKHSDMFPAPEFNQLQEFEWNQYIAEKKRELQGEMWGYKSGVIVYINDKVFGTSVDFIGWAHNNFNYSDFRPQILYEILMDQEYQSFLKSKNHDYVFLEFSIDKRPIGKLLIELYTDVVPKTCKNFKTLCIGSESSTISDYKLDYKGSQIHRIVKNGWIQGGDVYEGKGDGGESIYGPVFEDENFALPHNKCGVVGMANKGCHTNGSQFYITLQQVPWMNHRYVAFGQVVEGMQTLQTIAAMKTQNERPLKSVQIEDAGEYLYQF